MRCATKAVGHESIIVARAVAEGTTVWKGKDGVVFCCRQVGGSLLGCASCVGRGPLLHIVNA